MINVIKQIVSLVLPVSVLVVIPLWIEDDWTVRPGISLIFGVLLIMAGMLVMILTISSFIRIGKGTLAPWSPTKKLVVRGLYRYVRNPMILGVFTVLLGEVLLIRSTNILIWAAIFFVINTVYFIIYEEPNLQQRFGDEYREYKKHVPRWLPRITPYQGQNKT